MKQTALQEYYIATRPLSQPFAFAIKEIEGKEDKTIKQWVEETLIQWIKNQSQSARASGIASLSFEAQRSLLTMFQTIAFDELKEDHRDAGKGLLMWDTWAQEKIFQVVIHRAENLQKFSKTFDEWNIYERYMVAFDLSPIYGYQEQEGQEDDGFFEPEVDYSNIHPWSIPSVFLNTLAFLRSTPNGSSMDDIMQTVRGEKYWYVEEARDLGLTLAQIHALRFNTPRGRLILQYLRQQQAKVGDPMHLLCDSIQNKETGVSDFALKAGLYGLSFEDLQGHTFTQVSLDFLSTRPLGQSAKEAMREIQGEDEEVIRKRVNEDVNSRIEGADLSAWPFDKQRALSIYFERLGSQSSVENVLEQLKGLSSSQILLASLGLDVSDTQVKGFDEYALEGLRRTILKDPGMDPKSALQIIQSLTRQERRLVASGFRPEDVKGMFWGVDTKLLHLAIEHARALKFFLPSDSVRKILNHLSVAQRVEHRDAASALKREFNIPILQTYFDTLNMGAVRAMRNKFPFDQACYSANKRLEHCDGKLKAFVENFREIVSIKDFDRQLFSTLPREIIGRIQSFLMFDDMKLIVAFKACPSSSMSIQDASRHNVREQDKTSEGGAKKNDDGISPWMKVQLSYHPEFK